VRGGGAATRESDVLSPAAAAPGANAVLLTGGSAFGLAAADGVVEYLAERGVGYPTRVARVPLVASAVVYDLALGDPEARPRSEHAYEACAAAGAEVERGSVGAGTGCSVGKFLGMEHATKGGLGFAATELGGTRICALAVVNALGEVADDDGNVLAGIWRDGAYVRATEVLRESGRIEAPSRENTTLVCVLTDARLTKTEAWLVARSASAGLARAVHPSATAYDGDVAFCLASGRTEADPLAVSILAADVTAAAIRDGVRRATGAPGCPSASERGG
jgi:L-aminopeptidase/D-esterase-like protein